MYRLAFKLQLALKRVLPDRWILMFWPAAAAMRWTASPRHFEQMCGECHVPRAVP
jgi:hypothetical protein